MSEQREKDVWDKANSLSVPIATILIPIVVVIVGNLYSSALKESENRVKYTELAISILKDKPSSENQSIRGWAIEVINQYSGVPMTSEVKKELQNSKLIAVDFSGSDFSMSKFATSNFDYSLFSGSSFRYAKFDNVDFRGADLSHVIIDKTTQMPK